MKIINALIALLALIGGFLASIVASVYVMYGVGYTIGYFTTHIFGGTPLDVATWFAVFGAAFPFMIILVFLFAVFVSTDELELEGTEVTHEELQAFFDNINRDDKDDKEND